MQGKKSYQEKIFTSFQLSEYVPKNNFYRQLKEIIDFQFLYERTKYFYGSCGQKSIDPVVFFKLCLVGYLENIISDRQLLSHSKMRLDILYFLDYDIDEDLPWHSTLSRTRQLYPECLFEEVFSEVLALCVSKGMVSGHTQVLDSAPVKANASMDSLELKVPESELQDYLRQVRHFSKMDKHETPSRKAKNNKASEEQKIVSASKKELKSITARTKRWSSEQNQRPGAGNKGSKYTSNKTHYSPVDPDARISVKPGKARKLNYLSQMAVDSSHHVITEIKAFHADGKDNQHLQEMTLRLKNKLWKEGIPMGTLLADAGYSSGENYAFLEAQHITSYIPPHGTYKGGPEDFVYVQKVDAFICQKGKVIPFVKYFLDARTKTKKKEYRASKHLCKGCSIREVCLGKSQEKRITLTAFRAEYERNNKRVFSKYGQMMKKVRQSRVEPVFGTLTQFLGMRKVNTRGLAQANKVMLMAAVAYNIKKYLKFDGKRSETKQLGRRFLNCISNILYGLILGSLNPFKYSY